jgi:hypothetical protein
MPNNVLLCAGMLCSIAAPAPIEGGSKSGIRKYIPNNKNSTPAILCLMIVFLLLLIPFV